MHTGVISFCDRIAYNIKSSDTKDVILNELEAKYQIRILQKHWQLVNETNVQQIYRSPHMACLRSNGNPYYCYFTKYDDTPIIYYIDKKVQPGYQKPRIILGRGLFDPSVFENTVIEGEMIKDKHGKWLFLINDVIAYKGEYLENMPFPKRLQYAYDLLTRQYQTDDYVDVCTFHVKQFVYATKDGLDYLLEFNETLPYTNRGIYYWPFYLRYKPKLVNFDPSLIKEVHRKVKDTPDFKESVPVSAPEPRTPRTPETLSPVKTPVPKPVVCEAEIAHLKHDERILWLRKTDQPDVYEVLEQDNLQSNKMGVAHVASLITSKMLRREFKEATVAVLIPFKCVYNEGFKKWHPLSKASSQ